MAPYYSKAYLSTQVKTADRIDLIIALYEGAMASVNQAIEAIENKDDNRRMEVLEKASKIIMALAEGLDFSQDQGLSGQLFSLYNYMLRQLLESNRSKDVEPLEVVRSTLAILLDGWLQVSKSDEAMEIRRIDAEERARTGRETMATSNGRSALVMTA